MSSGSVGLRKQRGSACHRPYYLSPSPCPSPCLPPPPLCPSYLDARHLGARQRRRERERLVVEPRERAAAQGRVDVKAAQRRAGADGAAVALQQRAERREALGDGGCVFGGLLWALL